MRDDSEASRAAGLKFETEKGAGRSKWIALALIVLLVGWMGSGVFLPASEEAPAARTEPKPVAVAVLESRARPVSRVLLAEGQALPDRDTDIKAEASGQIAEVLVRKGAILQPGDVIARIAPGERLAALERAREDLRAAERAFDNTERLFRRGTATEDALTNARAARVAAEAAVTAAQKAVDDLTISAPFAGRLDGLDIDPGEFVSLGDPVARIVDTDPLTVTIQVPQQSLSELETGMPAAVRFITGEETGGVITFVGASADADTRTFRVEVEVANPDAAIPAGLSAQVRIPVGETVAHFISPAILSLDTDGTLGVKTVDAENRVVFHEVDIVRAETDGIWISGLPDDARIITVGQGFVSQGEIVAPHVQESAG